MYEDADFKIDKESDNYKATKPTEGNNYDSDDEKEEDEEINNIYKPKTPNLNNLFSGKEEQDDNEDGEDSDEVKTFENKMKKDKKRPKSDKIIKNYGDINKKMREKGELMMKASGKSKTIKKFEQKLKKGDITEKEVREKLKSRRVVVSSRQLNAAKPTAGRR
jgi:hypothetical protein